LTDLLISAADLEPAAQLVMDVFNPDLKEKSLALKS